MSVKILIDNGHIFEGDLDQFKDCFFSNACPALIRIWAADHGFTCEITDEEVEP